MSVNRATRPMGRQQGVAMLVIVMGIVLVSASVFLTTLSTDEIELNRTKKTQQSLKLAKEALITYALAHANGIGSGELGEHGWLPCPDVTPSTNEGAQDGTCAGGSTNALGYLPWRTLGLPVLRDGDGECLLYAVSSTYTSSPSMLNEDSLGMFQVVDETAAVIEGVNPQDRPVAIVIAPGKALAGQVRTRVANSACGEITDWGVFLEGDGVTDNASLSTGANQIDQFIHATATSDEASPPYNDRFITITRDEIWPHIVARNDFLPKMRALTEALAVCLKEYANDPANTGRRLPWPVKIDFDFNSDGDNEDDYYTTNKVYEDDYTKDNNYADYNKAADGYFGRIPYNVVQSNDLTGVTTTSDWLFDPVLCGGMTSSNGYPVELGVATDEFRHLWEHWKDHFFYVLSRAYEPEVSAVRQQCGINDCIKASPVSDNRAGMVIFAGSRTVDLITDYNDIAEFLVATNAANAPDLNGNSTYETVAIENDILFCITDEAPGLGVDLNVSEDCN